MSRSLLTELSRYSHLDSAWIEFYQDRKNRKSTGVDGVTMTQFERMRHENLRKISSDLKAGYKFLPLKAVPVIKPNGKTRLICVPTVKDRLVQRVLGVALTDMAEKLGIVSHISYGFLKHKNEKRGVFQARERAIELRQREPYVLKTDISAFFDQIDREKLINVVCSKVRAKSIRPILVAAASCEISYNSQSIRRIAQQAGITAGRGVRQGMPLSPIFANFILADFDRRMIDRGVSMVRYADDIIAFTNSRQEALEIDDLVRQELKKVGLATPLLYEGSKTVLSEPHEDAEFLGLVLRLCSDGNYELVISDSQMEKILTRFRDFPSIDVHVNNEKTLQDFIVDLERSAVGLKSAYAAAQNCKRLEEKLQNISGRCLQHYLGSVFGASAVARLSKAQKQFFGIETNSSDRKNGGRRKRPSPPPPLPKPHPLPTPVLRDELHTGVLQRGAELGDRGVPGGEGAGLELEAGDGRVGDA